MARVMRVKITANPRDVHCEPTMRVFTSIVVEATPVNSVPENTHVSPVDE